MTKDPENPLGEPLNPKKRSLTSLSLQWLAERLLKAERIKSELAQGTYVVPTSKIAEAMVSSTGSESAEEKDPSPPPRGA
jgi:hypothetical protein